MVLIRIVNRFIIILSLLLLLLITRYYNYLIRYLNYYPLKCREPRENGSREGVRRMGEGGEKRERGKGEKKGDLIRERRAFFPEIRVGVLDPSSVHDCIYTIASLSPLFLSFHTRGSTGLIRAHLAAPSSNLLLESSSRTEAYHHPLWKKKKKKRNTRSADQPTFNTGTIGLLRQPPSSASHLAWLSSRNPVEEYLVLRLVTLLPSPSDLASAARSPSNHLPWEGAALSTDDPRPLTTLHNPSSLFTTASWPVRSPRACTIFRREARHRRTHDPRGTNPLETEHKHRQLQRWHARETRGSSFLSSSPRARSGARMRETRGPSGVSRIMCCSLSRRREGERGGRGERSGPRRRFDAACPWSVSSVPSVEKRGGRILVVLERGRWCCVRACVRTCGHLELASWMFGNALQPRGTSQELGLPLASCAGWRPLLAGSPRDEEGRSAGWDGARGKAVCMCALSGGHACALRTCASRIPMCARTCAREGEREGEREVGWLTGGWLVARPSAPSDGSSVGAPSDGVGEREAQASGRRQHPTAVAWQSTLDHRPIGPSTTAKKNVSQMGAWY